MKCNTQKQLSRLGFFAGSFDPVHDGHMEVVRSALSQLDLESVYFMVEENPWGSKSPVDVRHRRNMVDLIISNDNKTRQIKLSTRQFSTAETLPELENKFSDSEMYFIFGADVFMKMNAKQWPGLEQLLEHYIVVFERRDITEEMISDQARKLGIAVAVLPSMHPDHSSTDVRVKPHDKSVWVDKRVADYIDENELY